MPSVESALISCPNCGEMISVLVDTTDSGQDYVEDCQVCCRPIRMMAVCDEMGHLLRVEVSSEDDIY
ncbi:CPXCG motif-containing cysteine-rich protein [Allohahella marinimesophila]|uniref:CPXCG motif-containing cysteine-rich protein n=1 Tax=Allohahella marinimesophila TaxID=1054972 RepID=A0ABP7P6Y7_9GAMM